MSAGAQPQFGLLKSICFSLLLIGLCLGLAELAVRAWSYYLRDPVQTFDLETQTFVLIPGAHPAGSIVARINSDGFVGPELRTDSPRPWRIAALGDSCTYGDGTLEGTYPARLQRLLDARRPGEPGYEVVNAGIEGLNSELALRRLRSKVLPLEPEVVSLYIGWNDLMKFDPSGQSAGARLSGLARVLDRLWLVKGLRKLLFFHLRPHLSPPATGPGSHSGRFADFRPTVYEANLREMIASVRGSGSRPLLLTLPSVLRADMSAAELRAAGVIFPYFSSAYAVGDLLDLIAAYNTAIRRVGRDEGVPIVDLAATFELVDDPTRYFFDTMHARPAGLDRIAEELYRGLERERLLGPPPAAAR
jgi:lysophospholipase L1-like esterase